MMIRTCSLGLLLLALGACTRAHEPEPATAPAPSADSTTEDAPVVGFVDATIMFTNCGKVANLNAKSAQRTMRQLVEACEEVPGGSAEFTATLWPDGRIELATLDGGVGTVPVCVLRHELKHKVKVSKPCTMSVHISEKKPATKP
jgi:hypothetical protein